MDATDPDTALGVLREILRESRELLECDALETEADTRANVIDRLVHEVLCWPRNRTRREVRIESKYADYILSTRRPLVVLEAKRYGERFRIPMTGRRRLRLDGTLTTNKSAWDAILQVQRYASDEGIPFAVATNGHQWIVFRAVDPASPWKTNEAMVFRSLDDILGKFVEFWNCLSYPAVRDGSLSERLGRNRSSEPPSERPIAHFRNPGEGFDRNPLHLQLRPLIDGVFRDITRDASTLRACYVVERATVQTTKGLRTALEDTVPHFATVDDVVHTKSGKTFKRKMQEVIKAPQTGTTVMLMGGVGSGKTTFLHRFFNFVDRKFIDSWCHWFSIEFTKASPSESIDTYIYRQIINQIRKRYPGLEIDKWATYEKVFEADLQRASEGVLHGITGDRLKEERRLLIKEWSSTPELLLERLFHRLQTHRGKSITIVIDNVDQTSFEYQQELFLLGHHIADRFRCIVVLSLREETYFASRRLGAFDAYHNIRFHIPSPDFEEVMRLRLGYGQSLLQLENSALKARLATSTDIDRDQVSNFFRIVRGSFFERNDRIMRCIRAISGGNTRLGLDMCNSFMMSGYADVEKMLRLDEEHGYTVGFHEFVKSIMLGDRRFYQEAHSQVANLFALTDSINSSHFTCLRLLRYLLDRSDRAGGRLGTGFVSISEALHGTTEFVGSERDCERGLQKLLEWSLVEVDDRGKSLEAASYVRITPAGEFYLQYLSVSFVYYDQVMVDTPIRDLDLVGRIRDAQYITDIHERLDRCADFLGYLAAEEDRELAEVPTQVRVHLQFMPTTRELIEDREFHAIRRSAARRERDAARRSRRRGRRQK